MCNGGAGIKANRTCAGPPKNLDRAKAPALDSAADIGNLNAADLVVLGAAKVGSAAGSAGGYATGLSVSSVAGHRPNLSPVMFQARYVAAGSASAGPLLAALPANKAGKTANPAELRFLPQVIAGAPNDILGGSEGYAVQAIILPAWFEQLPFYNAAAAKAPKPNEYHAWDMALLKLLSSVNCYKCTLAPSIISVPKGISAYTAAFSLAGASDSYQLSQSAPCTASLLLGLPVAYTKCAAEPGQTGGPLLPAATPFDIDATMPGLPDDVEAFNWPAFGLYTGGTTANSSSMMLQFTPAHLKWMYYAGAADAAFYNCSGVGLKQKCKPYAAEPLQF
ncbi:hypothetical protein OEZ86_000897 [Tetradesmus obliquus]|nr:hypothetical protein OEZ86_000897 [Tetradesmus obliquus]